MADTPITEENADIWRKNLNQLSDMFESRKEFADLMGRSPNYLYQQLAGSRDFSSRAARAYERRLGVERLWLDTERSKAELADIAKRIVKIEEPAPATNPVALEPQQSDINFEIVRDCVEHVIDIAREETEVSSAILARVVVSLYKDHIKDPEKYKRNKSPAKDANGG